MLELEPSGQRSCMATRSGENGREAITGATLVAFARWLHHKYTPLHCHWQGPYHLPCDASFVKVCRMCSVYM